MKIGFIYALAAAVTWGLVYALDQRILVKTTPLNLLFAGTVVTAIFLLPVVFMGNPFTAILKSGTTNVALIVLTCFLNFAAAWFIYLSIQSVGASSATMIEMTYPFFVVLFSYFLFGQGITPTIALGGFFLFIGAFIITRAG